MERRRREPKRQTAEIDWQEGWAATKDDTPGDTISWGFIEAVKKQHHVRKEDVIRRHYHDAATNTVENLAQQLRRIRKSVDRTLEEQENWFESLDKSGQVQCQIPQLDSSFSETQPTAKSTAWFRSSLESGPCQARSG